MASEADVASSLAAVSLEDPEAQQPSPTALIAAATSSDHAQQQQTSLTDLPAAWLQLLPGELTPLARLALFRACRAMRDLVLSQSNLRLRFRLPISAERTSAAKNMVWACQHSRSIDLQLVSADQAPVADSSACNLMASAMAAAGQGLTAIKTVHLEGLALDALVPSWLSSTCPHMTSLQLQSCWFIKLLPAPTTSTIPVCSQLKQLHLLQSSPDVRRQPVFVWVQSLLHALPGLGSLSSADQGLPPQQVLQQAHSSWLRCVTVIGSQLTELSLMQLVVDDDAMEVLLSMPTLSRLQCQDFRVRQSYTQRPCGWTQLHFTQLDITSFANLPLDGVQSLQLTTTSAAQAISVVLSGDLTGINLAATKRAVAAISKSGGLQWVGTIQQVTVVGSVEEEHEQAGACLVAALPLLYSCPAGIAMSFASVQVVPGVLYPIVKLLVDMQVRHVAFSSCVFSPSIWPMLLQRLQIFALRSVSFGSIRVGNEPMSAAVLAEMCCHAFRPVTIVVKEGNADLGAGWEQQVQAIMAAYPVAAWHKYVELVSD